jgi:glycerophosphoryl diester phosphodiesterase
MPRLYLWTLFLCAVCPSLALAQPYFDFFQPVAPPRPVQVTVHRGMFKSAPENSAAAVQMCIEDYCEWAEVDVRLSKDGKHVIIHDETVDSTTNGKGKVSELTLEELKSLDAGSWFASRFTETRLQTLVELLSMAKGRINLYLDCKQIDAKLLVEEIKAAGMERQVVVYAKPAVLTQVKAASQGTVAIMTKFHSETDVAAILKELSPAAVEIDADEINADLCRRFHEAGVKIQANVFGEKWDQPKIWQQVIDAGADWLQTDDPAGVLYFNARRKIGTFPVMIACHRGASRYAPENTIPAIRIAAEIGADFAEIDIRTTKDGKHVLVHDSNVNRTTDKKGPVRDFTFDELTGLSAGAWYGKSYRDSRIPSFDEGLSAYGPKLGAYLDAKDIAPEALIAAIKKYDLSNRHVVYQSLEYCDRLRKLDPTVRAMPPLRRVEDVKAVAAIGAYAVDANWSILSQQMIAECHRHKIKVFSDALGKNENVEQYMKAIGWGIDCIQTDHPLRVLRAIELAAQPAAK